LQKIFLEDGHEGYQKFLYLMQIQKKVNLPLKNAPKKVTG
jgi:hypothetical protein